MTKMIAIITPSVFTTCAAAFMAVVIFSAFAPILCAARPAPALNTDTVLDAIVEVENWNHYSIGAAGERGPWQITRGVWHQYSSKPFAWAECRDLDEKIECRRVARAHGRWIRTVLKDMSMEDSAYNFALIWTAGYGAVANQGASSEKKQYAQRVENCYQEIAR